jgi:hypothetical protein
MTGRDDVFASLLTGECVVPLNEIPKYIHPETRDLIESALEQAWQELKSVALARRKLAGTIVALTSVGETDPAKLKQFALHAARAMAHWALAGRQGRSRS